MLDHRNNTDGILVSYQTWNGTLVDIVRTLIDVLA
ncbi:hypothetical protein PM8797T_01524 [Gimesia maris DSM 8797]|nr:hypothetical protein PM8797T_01524 [Gimesia maris DSM 8797]